MKKVIENEITRGVLIGVLGVDMFITICLGSYLFERYNIAHVEVHPFVTGMLIVVGIALFATIMRSAGHYRGEAKVEPNFLDRIPLEIYLIVDGTVIGLLVVLLGYAIRNIYGFELIFFLLAGIYLASIFMCMSIAVRCKAKTLVTNTVVYITYNAIYSAIKNSVLKVKNSTEYYVSRISYLWQMIIAVCIMGIVDLLIFRSCRWNGDSFIAFQMIKLAVLFVLGGRYVISFQKIREGTERIAQGDTDYKIDTKKMPLTMSQQAEKLNSINAAVANAVEKQLKSEKLKTELITNVSHDIKTPLTSIINYIDLLKKEQLSSRTALEYVEVLGRQSDRLKKLVEDLVEASKASTGNIAITLADTNLNLLLGQVAGEYADKAEASQLELALAVPQEDVFILSDGRLLWRVFDNLMNNACKYSLPGTRIYITLEKQNNNAVIMLKNISSSKLNISADELMERFVRGDSSRNTEGSGLGLNIAQSLVGILGGEMTLYIDGDLFKVVITFPELKI